MPLPSDRDGRSKDAGQSTDPFTSFSKFVDERISYMLQSIIGLPSSKENMQSWKPWEELQKQDRHPWGWGFDEKHKQDATDEENNRRVKSQNDTDRVSPDKATTCPREQELSWPRILEEAIRYPFSLNDALVDQIRQAERVQDNMPPTSVMLHNRSADHDAVERCGASEALSNLENYLISSPYSPTNLERDHALRPFASRWRAAFTDLMNESHGGALPYINQNRYLTTDRLEANTWRSFFLMNFGYNFHINAMRRELAPKTATSLLDPMALAVYMSSAERMSTDIRRHEQNYLRGIRGFHPELADRSEEFDDDDFDDDTEDADDNGEERDLDDEDDDQEYDEDTRTAHNEAATELDMLEKIVKDFFRNDSQHTHGKSTNNTMTEAAEPEKPSIIGRLTTIERVTKPDGTVETRRVLKTRFSDGSENTEESKDVVLGHSQSSAQEANSIQPSNKPEGERIAEKTSKTSEAGKGGWFWKRNND